MIVSVRWNFQSSPVEVPQFGGLSPHKLQISTACNTNEIYSMSKRKTNEIYILRDVLIRFKINRVQ